MYGCAKIQTCLAIRTDSVYPPLDAAVIAMNGWAKVVQFVVLVVDQQLTLSKLNYPSYRWVTSLVTNRS